MTVEYCPGNFIASSIPTFGILLNIFGKLTNNKIGWLLLILLDKVRKKRVSSGI